MRRQDYEINLLIFNIRDIKEMSDLQLVSISSQCQDVRKDFVNAEIKRRQKQNKRKKKAV